MTYWRLSFWLIVAGIYGIATALGWGRWEDLAFWTRAHASVELSTGLSMLLGAIGLLVFGTRSRWVVLVCAAAPALLGASLIGGSLLGGIPCTGPT
jgi:hypothetical protein